MHIKQIWWELPQRELPQNINSCLWLSFLLFFKNVSTSSVDYLESPHSHPITTVRLLVCANWHPMKLIFTTGEFHLACMKTVI